MFAWLNKGSGASPPAGEPNSTLQSWRRVGGAWQRLPDLTWGQALVELSGHYALGSLVALPDGSALVCGWQTNGWQTEPGDTPYYTPIGPYRLE